MDSIMPFLPSLSFLLSVLFWMAMFSMILTPYSFMGASHEEIGISEAQWRHRKKTIKVMTVVGAIVVVPGYFFSTSTFVMAHGAKWSVLGNVFGINPTDHCCRFTNAVYCGVLSAKMSPHYFRQSSDIHVYHHVWGVVLQCFVTRRHLLLVQQNASGAIATGCSTAH